jgi:hypothetical protein
MQDKELIEIIRKCPLSSKQIKIIVTELRHRKFYVAYPRSPTAVPEYVWKNVSEEKLKNANYRCEICGNNDREKLIVHHKEALNGVPYIGSILNHPSNLQVLCKSCHSKIGWSRRRERECYMPKNWGKPYTKKPFPSNKKAHKINWGVIPENDYEYV